MSRRHWREVWEGLRCEHCEWKSPLRLTIVTAKPLRGRRTFSRPGNPTHDYSVRSRCVDREACNERRRKSDERDLEHRAKRSVRSSALQVALPPSPGGPPGSCQWCGGPLLGKNGRPPAKNRLYCHEDREGRACNDEKYHSIVFSARAALLRVVPDFRCADCHTPCNGPGREGADWEADHEVPLWDGGEHVLENLRVRCVPCHRAKTAREAKERARRGAPPAPTLFES